MSIYFFTQNYWNYFTHTKMVFGDVLFNQNDERKEIYFIQDGEFKLTSYQLSHKKINLIINQLGNINFEKMIMLILENQLIFLYLMLKKEIF